MPWFCKPFPIYSDYSKGMLVLSFLLFLALLTVLKHHNTVISFRYFLEKKRWYIMHRMYVVFSQKRGMSRPSKIKGEPSKVSYRVAFIVTWWLLNELIQHWGEWLKQQYRCLNPNHVMLTSYYFVFEDFKVNSNRLVLTKPPNRCLPIRPRWARFPWLVRLLLLYLITQYDWVKSSHKLLGKMLLDWHLCLLLY